MVSRQVQIEVDSPEMASALERFSRQFIALYREKRHVAEKRFVDRAVRFLLEVAPVEVGDDPQLIRNAKARARFLAEDKPYTAAEASRRLGSTAKNETAMASRLKQAGKLLAVRDGTVEKYPRFQFDSHGRPLPAMGEILAVFTGRLEGWEIALWFHSNNGWLPGEARPVDLLRKNPDAVLAAAKHEVDGARF